MSRTRIVVPPYLVYKYCPVIIFSIFSKKTCTLLNSVTFCDIFMKLYMDVYQVKIICRVHLRLLSVSELWSFDCVFIFILCNVHSCTYHNSLRI